MRSNNARRPIRGVGVGLRHPHYQYILQHHPDIPWFEALTDNYLAPESIPRSYLLAIREHYPITLHGVGLSLGSTDPLDTDYLQRLKALRDAVEPAWMSDHLCWSSVAQHYLHDLMPLPYTEEVIAHVTDRIVQVQDFLGEQILIENVSTYLSYTSSQMRECEFLSTVAERADCHLLLDVNNIYVSASNNHFQAKKYLDNLPASRIKQFHLAGFEDQGTHLLDTHSHPVHEPVWELYQQALETLGPRPTLIEWDRNIPDFPRLKQEADKAQAITQAYLSVAEAGGEHTSHV